MNQPNEFAGDAPGHEALQLRNQDNGESGAGQIKSKISEQLRKAAHSLGSNSSSTGQESSLQGYKNQAARWLEKSASYVEHADLDRVKTDIADQARQHPGRSLLIAGAVGLVLGSLLRRR
jgi:ElaB/YqjD/DUF883 family membrane-anchored ribosome-binding protein